MWNTLTHNRTDIVTARFEGSRSVPRCRCWITTAARGCGGRTRRTIGELAGSRRAVTGLAGLPVGPRGRHRPAGGAGGRLQHRQRALPAGGRRGPRRRRSLLVDSTMRPRADRRRPSGQRARRLRGIPVAPDAGRGPVAPAAQGAGGVLVGIARARCRPTTARSVSGWWCAAAIGTLLRYTQTLTLWRGVARVDCRTTIDEFIGEDRLLRLRWPCPVPGAMPVSEVGRRRRGTRFRVAAQRSLRPIGGHRRAPVDAGQPGLQLVRAVLGGPGARRTIRRAGGVGGRGRVARPRRCRGPLARDLMVALVRAGVTATCSGADKPRYGHLDVDSNLPDTRIALGGPDPQRLHQSRAGAGRSGLHRENSTGSWPTTGRARVWVPAATPLAAVWVPGADLRDVRALPVLVIDGRDEKNLRRGDRVGDRRPRRRRDPVVDPARPVGNANAFEARTVALLNRGVPELRRRDRRHPAHRADALLHRLAVRRLDRRAAPHRARRLELPTSALDTRFRLRAGLRGRRLAARRDPGPQCAVLPPAARRHPAGPAGRRASWRRSARCCTSSPPTRCTWAPSRRPATRWRAAAPSRSTPARWRMRLVETTGSGDAASPSAPSWARCARCSSPTCWKRRWKSQDAQTVGRPARLPGGDRAGPARGAQAAARRPIRSWPRRPASRSRPAAVCAVLAAQPRPRATRRAARRRAPAPAAG